LREAVVDVLGNEAWSRDSIRNELTRRGVAGAELLDRLLQLDTTFATVSAGVIHLPSVLEGTSWTVPVDRDDARQGVVRMHPHLDPLGWWLIGDDVDLVDDAGKVVGPLGTDGLMLDDVDTDVVLGPAGWLDDLAGGWATVTVTGGALRWSGCDRPPAPTDAQVAAMRAGFHRAADTESVEMFGDDGPVGLRFATGEWPILEALVRDPESFAGAPIPPLPDLYRASGLEEQDGTIAEEGFDWAALGSWRARYSYELFYDLDERQAEGLALVHGACRAVHAGEADALGPDDDQREKAAMLLAGLLEDGLLAEAFWDECEAARDLRVADVARFVDEVAAHLGGSVPVGLAWLRARCLDRSGATAAAVTTLEEAITSECDHRPALLELAGFAADRGDASAAYRLLQRAGITERSEDDDREPDDGDLLLDEIEEFAVHRPRPAAKRNDPCPCGSGRKYKSCHLGREQHPLDRRATWLYEKALRFMRNRDEGDVHELAHTMAEAMEDLDSCEELQDLDFVADLALHEGGRFAEFLAARDGLLPDDESMLAAQWGLVDRGVFEVEGQNRDRLDLRDIASGERISVVNVGRDDADVRGRVMIGRPLPVGDTCRAFSGLIEVPRAAAGDLQAAIDDRDEFEIAQCLGETRRPPRVSNTDGEDLVFHTLRWRVTDPVAVDGALRAAGLDAEGDEPAWRLTRDSGNMANATIAALRLDGSELVGEVNSDERADELLGLVGVALPDAEFVVDDVREFDEALEDFDPGDVPGPLDQNDPAIRQVLEQFILQQEQRWLDESIPALGGRTPREAVADPVGREELTQLIDSFPGPTPDNPGTFDPQRLRRALGL
jgi:hypothetical protein